jgi:hypothetical protein
MYFYQKLNVSQHCSFQNFHALFVTDFVKEHLDGFSFRDCLVEPEPKEPEGKDVIVGKIVDGFKEYCKLKKINPQLCDVTWVNLFFIAHVCNKYEPDVEIAALAKVVENHAKQVRIRIIS